MEDWNLRAFIFSQDELEEGEKELCFKLLDGQGFSSAKKRRAFVALNEADLQNVGIGQIATRKALLLAIAVSKTVDVFMVKLDSEEEEKEVAYTITFKDQTSLEDFLPGLSGLVRVPEEEGMKPVLIRDIKYLEDGQAYRIAHYEQNSITRMRKEQTHLTQRREDEASQGEDPTCVLEPSMRVLQNSEGRDEMEVDGVIMCDSQAIARSHKTHYTGARMLKAIASSAKAIELKSSVAAYAGTRYAQFSGKKVVPAFMAESIAATAEVSLRRAGQEHGVGLYRRNGSGISPWASMKPLQRAASHQTVLRRVV